MSYCDDDDHLFSDVWCERCGKYQGQTCDHCGAWYDGGDHMAAQPELWCDCAIEVTEDGAAYYL
jgi:hypothetical protein